MKIVIAALNAKFIHPSLAARYLKACCLSEFPDTIIRDYTINNQVHDILSDIFTKRPKVLGLVCHIWNIEMTLELAGLVKKVMPDTVIVLGGPEVSYDPRELLKTNDFIDYIILGEGEEAWPKLLASIQGAVADNMIEIQGVAYRHNGSEVVNGGLQIVDNLDAIPFPYTKEDMAGLTDKIIYYESSRGCPFSCQYCLSSATQGVRFFSFERVCRDLDFLISCNVRQVKFVDRTFNAVKSQFMPIWRYLAEKDCRTNFHFEIAADLLDNEVLEFLRQVPQGRFQFEIGIQSTHDTTLEAIKRRNNWPRIVQSIEQIESYYNIHLHLDIIVGLPYENYTRFGQSFNDVYNLRPDMLQMGFLKLLKGSGIRNDAQKHGYKYADKAPYQVLANHYISYEEVRRLHIIEELLEQLYNSGRIRHTIDYLTALRQGDAFAVYDQLARYWDEHQLHLMAQSTKAVYRHVLNFCQDIYPEHTEIVAQILKWDALIGEKGILHIPELPWDNECWNEETSRFWRNEAVVRKYLPLYRFTTWRDIKKSYHIETFIEKMPEWLINGETVDNKTVVLFSFISGRTNYQVVDPEDFWV